MGQGKSKQRGKGIKNKVAQDVFQAWYKSLNAAGVSNVDSSLEKGVLRAFAAIPPSTDRSIAVDLGASGVHEVAAIALFHALEREGRPIHSLSLRKNKLSAPVFMQIANYMLLDTNLRDLDLSRNRIDDRTLQALVGSLSVNKCLHSLNMSRCELGNDGALTMSNLVLSNRALRHVDLSHNHISRTGVAALVAAHSRNHILLELVVTKNPGATDSMVHDLADMADTNMFFRSIIDRAVNNAVKTARGVQESKPRTLARHKSIRANRNWKKTMISKSMKKVCRKRQWKKQTKSKRFDIGVADTIGRRNEMQDEYVIRGKFLGDKKVDFVAVYDGHGGTDAAKFAGKYLHEILGLKLQVARAAEESGGLPMNPAVMLRETFREVSQKMAELEIHSGTTAVCCLIIGKRRYVANVGDSRLIMCRSGRAHRVTEDHKPDDPMEYERVLKQGGFVTDGRINGLLAVSRALGDTFLLPFVSPVPDIFTGTLTTNDRFLVLACDGVWDVLSDGQVIAICSMAPTAADAAQMIKDNAYQRGSTDNITAVVVFLRDRKGKSLLGVSTPKKSKGKERASYSPGSMPTQGAFASGKKLRPRPRARAHTIHEDLTAASSQRDIDVPLGPQTPLRRSRSYSRLAADSKTAAGLPRSRSLDFQELLAGGGDSSYDDDDDDDDDSSDASSSSDDSSSILGSNTSNTGTTTTTTSSASNSDDDDDSDTDSDSDDDDARGSSNTASSGDGSEETSGSSQ